MEKILLTITTALLIAGSCFAQDIPNDTLQIYNDAKKATIVDGTLKVRQGMIFKQDGKVLSKKELIKYFGIQGAMRYRSGVKNYKTGEQILSIAGLISAGGLLADAQNGFANLYDDGAPQMFLASLVLAVPCAVASAPFFCIGDIKLHRLAKKYNRKLIFGDQAP
jgi:hypothetical protein